MARLDVAETFYNIKFPGHMHTQDSLNYAANFKFQDTDTVIVTYPKSGTTWMQEIITLVLNKGDPTLARSQPNWLRAPWLEQYYCRQILQASTGPRIITTHLPYHILAPALRDSKAKVIYVARNPKDVAVSYYHFHKMANFLPDPGTFSEFLSDFLEGTVHYGSWFDHVKGWTDHAQNFQKFLYITYEEMCQDLHGSLKKVCRFLQCSLTEEELKFSQKHCSFNSMEENIMVNYTLIPQEIMDHSKGKFMRKGKIGDWKNMFTEEQSDVFDAVYSAQMADSSQLFKWEYFENSPKPMITISTPASIALRNCSTG
ncbi:Sulfotransferase family cytosolic 2B member 1 [Triplophysa tibetana]|uniref:Sulfotransferase n=1 Tax=Triplophysa tibetana TaxID=1572043 RepID=A0A5A9PQR5_9TELE|nr:Sulfotransferase family cytosolic 2B member 1 [Triplophysa tibetana]